MVLKSIKVKHEWYHQEVTGRASLILNLAVSSVKKKPDVKGNETMILVHMTDRSLPMHDKDKKLNDESVLLKIMSDGGAVSRYDC